ncbi:MAG: sodium-dependent transporter [bacterium]|nr:sodium-dependent transporter [bacterium]
MVAGRERWSSKTGFLLAAVGSAVGLGNMWRFSYLTAENGGAAFVLLYIVMTLLIGLPVLLAELTLGRGARRSPIEALGVFGGGAWKALGGLFVATGFLILAYYSVIAGWTARYAIEAVLTGFPENPGEYFGSIINGRAAVAWHLVFMAATTLTVMVGVKGGIERLSIVLMPLLFVLVCGLALFAMTLDGASAGYDFYLSVDWSKLFTAKVLNDAASQAFFSLSLGMGAIMTYASYLPEDSHLPNESIIIATADFGVAFIAGLAVFPMIFAFGLSDQVNGSTVGALFITLPAAFNEMGTAGYLVGILFFVALVIGALTSAISLLEVVVSSAMDVLGLSRRTAALSAGGLIAALGIIPALDDGRLDVMDKLAGNAFLVAGGLILAVFVGWVMRNPLDEVSKGATGVRWFGLWRWLLRIPVPLVLAYTLFEFVRGWNAGS